MAVISRSSFLTNECTENKVLQLSILKIGLRCAPREGMVNGTQDGSEFDWLQLFNIPGIDLEVHIMEFDRTCGEKLAGIHPSKFIDFHYLGPKGHNKTVVASQGSNKGRFKTRMQ